MRLANLLGAGALIAGTLIAAAPAEAQRHGYRDGWHHGGSAYGYGRGYGYRGGGYYGRPYRYGYRPYGYRGGYGYRHGYRAYAYRHRDYRFR